MGYLHGLLDPLSSDSLSLAEVVWPRQTRGKISRMSHRITTSLRTTARVTVAPSRTQAPSDAELLALFINTGTKGENAPQIGERILREHGSIRHFQGSNRLPR